MKVSGIDHVVLTVMDIDATVRFYESVMGMTREVFGDGRIALTFGSQKLNLHESGNELAPRAKRPSPGAMDLCFVTDEPIDTALQHVAGHGVTIIEGPVRRTGAGGPIVSFYFRDPDGNLIEIASYKSVL